MNKAKLTAEDLVGLDPEALIESIYQEFHDVYEMTEFEACIRYQARQIIRAGMIHGMKDNADTNHREEEGS